MPLLVSVVRRFDRSAKTFRYSTENNAWILISSSVTNDSISKSRASNWCLCYNFKWFIIDNAEDIASKDILFTPNSKKKLFQPLATLEWTKRTNGIGYVEKTVFLTCKHTTRLNINCKKTLWALACTSYSRAVYIYYYDKCSFTCIIIYIFLYLFTILAFTIFTFRSFEIILLKSY